MDNVGLHHKRLVEAPFAALYEDGVVPAVIIVILAVSPYMVDVTILPLQL